jgi:hypothetical protein
MLGSANYNLSLFKYLLLRFMIGVRLEQQHEFENNR